MRRKFAGQGLALGLTGLVLLGFGCSQADQLCDEPGCEFSRDEWTRLQSLANLQDPPKDPTNRYEGVPAAETLGQKFFFDGRFSGSATLLDSLKRPMPFARAAVNQPLNISCATCHSASRGGVDVTSQPGHVSVGAGWMDVNALATVNSAYYDLVFWNGRGDSLWSLSATVTEGPTSLNGSRLKTAWLIYDKYRTDYAAAFSEYPLPFTETLAEATAKSIPFRKADGSVDPKGLQCKLVTDPNDPNALICPADCRTVTDTDNAANLSCWPRFPVAGKPGSKKGCQAGDPTEPLNDAFDCMDAADQKLITRVHVNFGKAVAAYEAKLISRNAPFDQFVNEGPKSKAISESARRGAKLFVGKAACVECHSTPFFSDNRFHNVAVPQVGTAVPTLADCAAGGACDCVNGKNCLPWGAYDGMGKLKTFALRRDSSWSDDPTDTSRKTFYDLDPTDELKGAWRTPSLRNVALTAPYMHDGSYQTLEDVVWHYDRGGSSVANVGKPAMQMRPLGLTDRDEADLVEFLKTLTGEAIPAELANAPVLP